MNFRLARTTPPKRKGAMIVTTTQGQENQDMLLTATQEKALCRRIQNNPHDKDAQDHIIRANIGLIRTIANKKQGNGVDVEDLIQEGCWAIIRAATAIQHVTRRSAEYLCSLEDQSGNATMHRK